MTIPPPPHLQLTTVDVEDGLRVELVGDLDYDTADRLLETVTAQLAARPSLGHLHLHCAGIGVTDSMGLSILLMIRRHAATANVQLHLDDRPASLNRLLEITGTLAHLTGDNPADVAQEASKPANSAHSHAG
jgi:anti-anti-sigma factor